MRFGKREIIATLIVAFLVFLIGGQILAGFLSELMWYTSLGLAEVFWTYWRGSLVVRGTAAIVIFAVVYLNLWVITRALGAIRVRRRYGNIEIAERLPHGYLIAALSLVSLFSAWWLSAGMADPLPILAALNPASWDLPDPAFGLDASFYVFRLPVLDRLQTIGSLVVFWVGLLATAAYVATGAIKLVEGRLTVSRQARRHLGILLAAFLFLFAVDVWLDRYGLVVDGNGFGGALGYTDVVARLPAKIILVVLALGTAAALSFAAWTGHLRPALYAGLLLPIALVGAEVVYPASVQRFVVEPNQFPREEPYIEHQLVFTRRAFGLDDIRRVEYPYEAHGQLDQQTLQARLAGIPLWDPRPLLTTYQAQQALFRYYTFTSVHLDRYLRGSTLEPVAVAVRELEPRELESAAQTWQNLHLNYVAGAGAVASPVTRMAANGTPIYYVWDLDPPKLSPEAPGSLAIEDPRIYFGERSTQYVILGPEHEPIGVALDSPWKKAIFAWMFRSKNILLSSDLSPGSKIVFRRVVTDRVRAAAPFIHVSRERGAYPVISEGRVVWIVDGYTSSAYFPLSPPLEFEGRLVRYLRSSVKATVDALTGEVRLFAVDTDDPILATYSRMFPGLIRPLEEMPPDLRSHLRYPVQMMSVQAQVLGYYHPDDAREFYAQEDVWAAATEHYRDMPATMEPSYSVYPLPDAESSEFLLSLPFVARGRQNMTALLVTRNDPPNYGEQILYLLPRDEQVPGPQQVEAAIDQDPEISQQLALWRRGGSGVIRGQLMVVPVGGTFVYVEPLFLEAANAAIPQLQRVVLAQAGRVVMRPTFESAVAALLGSAPEPVDESVEGTTEGVPPGTEWEPLARARAILDEAEAFLRAGDFAGFGRALQALREVLTPAPSTP